MLWISLADRTHHRIRTSTMRRTSFFLTAWTALCLPSLSLAQSVSYPSKPISLVVGSAPGGSIDIFARTIGKHLQDALRQPVLVENKPAGGGVIAGMSVARAPADGYSLLMVTSTFTTGAAIRTNLPYDALKSFKPVAILAKGPLLVTVSTDSPFKTVADLVANAKSNPGKLNYGTSGAGSINQFASELFADAARIKLTHVSYKGISPAITDLLGGQIQLIVASAPSILSQVKSGRARALAVTTAERSAVAPDLLPLEQAGYKGSAVELWWGILAPAGTPQVVVDRLNGEINKIVQSPEMRAFFLKEGAEPAVMKPADFATFIAAEIERWKKVAKAADIRPE